MPKQKTRKGIAKRVRVTRRGKVVRRRAGRRHLLSAKRRKRKRNLRRPAVMSRARARQTQRAMRD